MAESFTTLPTTIQAVLDEVRAKFTERNTQYRGGASEWYANFVTAQPVVRKLLSPVAYALVLASKQDDASFAAFSHHAGSLEERLLDGAVYRIIALALLKEGLT